MTCTIEVNSAPPTAARLPTAPDPCLFGAQSAAALAAEAGTGHHDRAAPHDPAGRALEAEGAGRRAFAATAA